MCQKWDNKTSHHCDIIFEKQTRLFAIENNTFWVIERNRTYELVYNSRNKDMPQGRIYWNNIYDATWFQTGQGENIPFTSKNTKHLDIT